MYIDANTRQRIYSYIENRNRHRDCALLYSRWTRRVLHQTRHCRTVSRRVATGQTRCTEERCALTTHFCVRATTHLAERLVQGGASVVCGSELAQNLSLLCNEFCNELCMKIVATPIRLRAPSHTACAHCALPHIYRAPLLAASLSIARQLSLASQSHSAAGGWGHANVSTRRTSANSGRQLYGTLGQMHPFPSLTRPPQHSHTPSSGKISTSRACRILQNATFGEAHPEL